MAMTHRQTIDHMKCILSPMLTLALVGGVLPMTAEAQQKTVSQEDYQRLLKEHEQLRKDFEELRAMQLQLSRSLTNRAPVVPVHGEAAGVAMDSGKELSAIKDQVKYVVPGLDKMMVTGYGSAGFESRHLEDKKFSAQFNPMFVWKPSDRWLFEGEMELELEGSETSTALEMAHLSYIANDYLTLSAGKFLNPMNAFVERFHMAWVNRLPDKPLAVYDGLLPETYLGFQARGGTELGSTKLNYAAFVANAPTLNSTAATADDVAALGTLNYNNFDNTNGHIATGGRIGFLPFPEIEFGYGVHYSGVGDPGNNTTALMQSVDFSWLHDADWLKGSLRLNAQYVWSHVKAMTYTDDTLAPVDFRNNRNGGYVQLAWRPTQFGPRFVKSLEPVVRWDTLRQANTPVGYNEERLTLGLNYWFRPNTVFKLAYQFDNKDHGAPDQNAILIQVSTGL